MQDNCLAGRSEEPRNDMSQFDRERMTIAEQIDPFDQPAIRTVKIERTQLAVMSGG